VLILPIIDGLQVVNDFEVLTMDYDQLCSDMPGIHERMIINTASEDTFHRTADEISPLTYAVR
jgi:hypothetical protein